MIFKTSRFAAIAAIAGAALGGAGIANAVTKHTTNQPSSTTGSASPTSKANRNETALTGDTLTRASDAALAANPGAKVIGATTEDSSENTSATYELHITKADGTFATVLEDAAFKVLSTTADHRHDGHHGRGNNPNEKALSGDDLAKATAAAKAAVTGATVDSATTEDPAENTGAAYEVHAHTASNELTLLLDQTFKVIKTETHTGHGSGGHHG